MRRLRGFMNRRQDLINDFRTKFQVSNRRNFDRFVAGQSIFSRQTNCRNFPRRRHFSRSRHFRFAHHVYRRFDFAFCSVFYAKKDCGNFCWRAVFLWTYAFAVGADVPVVRAAMMFTILLFSQVIYRSGTLLNALGFCAFDFARLATRRSFFINLFN